MTDAEKLKNRMSGEDFQKISSIGNSALEGFLALFVGLLNPDRVHVCDDSPADIEFIRREALRKGEERKLAAEGHTIHFDGVDDQARDKENTKFLLPSGVDLGESINWTDRKEGLQELKGIMKDIMKGRDLYVLFRCLGPENSEFSLPAVQLTDSAYVAHSETILYRPGYGEFTRRGENPQFFKCVHSAGRLGENMTSVEIGRRRVYIDCPGEIIYSVNTQYGGNTIGLKKLSMRLAIYRSGFRRWLCEHMFLMGVHGPGGRKTYFAGAFPSMCGKTSTAMVEGETIVGDDIIYLRKKKGVVLAVNVEKGMFGIIQGVNSTDDPIIRKALESRSEIIFSNMLATGDGGVCWTEKDGEVPSGGVNYAGDWFPGKKDEKGKDIPVSHKNARFTLDLHSLENVDPRIDDPDGIEVGGLIYGGRDSDTSVPVEQSFDWEHGMVIKGACLESETTAATLGQEGVRKFNPMSNLDFVSYTLGKYVQNCIEFGGDMAKPPPIFSVNYFLKGPDGEFLNEKTHKRVWLKWMELRVNGNLDAITTPTGRIPRYEDLRRLFKEVLDEDYGEDDYRLQFTIRIPENLAKIERVTGIYRTQVKGTPPVIFDVLEAQKKRLLDAREKHGDYVTPEKFEEV